jgi:hypothetical protein
MPMSDALLKVAARFSPLASAGFRFGTVRHVFQHINPGDQVGQELLETFLRAVAANDVSIDATALAGRKLLNWAKEQNWENAIKDQFRREVVRAFKMGTYGRAAIDVRVGEIVREILALDAAVVTKTWDVFRTHLGALAGTESLAFKAFQRISDPLGPLDKRWEWLIEYVQKDPAAIAAAGEEISAGLQKLATLPKGSAARSELLRQLQSPNAYFYKIRGILGELYLAKFPGLLAEMGEQLADARRIAAELGEGWQAKHVIGDIRIDSLEAYDQAVVIMNKNTGEVMIHSAVQMKVEAGGVTAFRQIERDITREVSARGLSALERTRLPVATIEIEGEQLAMSLVPPVDGMMTRRYVYMAEGGTVGPADAKRMEQLGVEVRAMAVDLPVSWFDTLALEIMLSAKKLL